MRLTDSTRMWRGVFRWKASLFRFLVCVIVLHITQHVGALKRSGGWVGQRMLGLQSLDCLARLRKQMTARRIACPPARVDLRPTK